MSAPFGGGPLRIITADERLREARGIKGVLTGTSGIGKTTQLLTLDPQRTLFLNLEAGELAVQGWPGDEIRIRDWEVARDLAAWIGGANPAMRDDQSYGPGHFARVCAAFGPASQLDKYDTVFVDSISVASRICLQWCKGQSQAQSDRTGKPDLRATYGLLGQEMIGWLTHLQHTPAKNIWLVGLLDRKLDDFGKPRIAAAITGKTPEGEDIKGEYKFTDEFPMADGFEENAEFFTLTYEAPVAVSHNLAFQRIAPLLWLRAGSEGRRIDDLPAAGWDVADTYGLLVDLDRAAAFCDAAAAQPTLRIAYVVTDDDRRFQAVARALPDSVEPVRLYESYLSNFRFSMGR